jgi:hypothetical protein
VPGTSETHRGVVKDRKSSASNAAYIAASRAPMACGEGVVLVTKGGRGVCTFSGFEQAEEHCPFLSLASYGLHRQIQ